ncbi:MAG: heme A synthase [Actinobacteria bacterium]|nr:heme A synthase [Actinomycetota bacterium]MTA64131.1 heme A synthase [Actinomycetota bacterium]
MSMTSTDNPDSPTSPAERFTLSAARYRQVAIVALALIGIIVVTGAAVRLTGSGLGCEDWPNCSNGELVEFGNPNQTIEQLNRLFTGLVSVAVIAAVLGSLRRRPYRRDLVWWSAGLVAGVIGQIVLGGITVLVDLHPAAVGGHFVLSMLLVSDATVLVWKASHDPGPTRPRVSRANLNLSRIAVATAALLMITGPLVTGSGPHAGDAKSPRFDLLIPDVARVHSINMWIFLIVTVVLLLRLGRAQTSADILRRGYYLLLVIVIQGGIGYTQYELGIPAGLVLAHIAGATLLVGTVLWFHLGLSGVQATDSTPL